MWSAVLPHAMLKYLKLLLWQVTAPWKLATVSLFIAAKYAEEKKVLAENALNCYLVKRMTHEQLCRAMELALGHANRHWAVLIRFCLAWMCSAARRSSDMLGLLYRSMCFSDFRQATDAEPLVRFGELLYLQDAEAWHDNSAVLQIGIGPHPSRALAFVAGEGKTLESGQVEASACVRCAFTGARLIPGACPPARVNCAVQQVLPLGAVPGVCGRRPHRLRVRRPATAHGNH